MKLFKTLRRKVGNAIVPVIGTILGLTILAGSVVGVAINSSKIVYRQNNLEKQNDARQVLYLACKYFCAEINDTNNPKTATQIREELQAIFGLGLKITKDKTKTDTYYIWYPNKYKTGNEYTTDANVAEWLKATITKKESDDDDDTAGQNGIGTTIFSENAKIDEKYAIGNLMTSYLADYGDQRTENLLPGRSYDVNQISIVESDIDTFDEAFTYMNNTGVLQIDDIVVALYKYKVLDEGEVEYISTPSKVFDPQNKEQKQQPYTIVYKTGNLGGNYYWLDGDENVETWLYRQEYDLETIAKMISQFEGVTINASSISYEYDETKDEHKITVAGKNYGDKYTYKSSQKFADALAEYIFWDNIALLVVNLPTVRDKFYEKLNDTLDSGYYTLIDDYDEFYEKVHDTSDRYYKYYRWIERNYYEWDNDGLQIVVNYRDYQLPGPDGLRWYTTNRYTKSTIISFVETYFRSELCGNDNKISSTKVYDALRTQYATTATTEYKYTIYEAAAQDHYLDPNNHNDLVNDVQNKNWNNGGCFTNTDKYTTNKYYLDSNLEVKKYERKSEQRYVRTDRHLTWHGWEYTDIYETVVTYNENPSGSYFYNPYVGTTDDDKYRTYNDWVAYYNTSGTHDGYNYFIDANGYLNPHFYTTTATEKNAKYVVSTGNDKLTKMIIAYLTGELKKKMEDTVALTQLVTDGSSHSTLGGDNITFVGFANESSDMIYQPQVFYENNKFKIQYRYIVVVKFDPEPSKTANLGYVSSWRYQVDNWLDEIWMEKEEFFNLFADGLTDEYVNNRMSNEEKQRIETIITTTDVPKQYIKQLLVEPLRYQYLPNSTLNSIVGNNFTTGMREDQITNKLVSYYVENNKDVFKSVGTDATGSQNFNYMIDIISNNYERYEGEEKYLKYVIEFRVSVDTNGDGDYTDTGTDVIITKKVAFLLQYMTYSALNNPKLNVSTGAYTEVKNNNFRSVSDTYTDVDGTEKTRTENIFWLVNTKDSNEAELTYDSIVLESVPTILTAIPYTKREEGSNDVVYGNNRVSASAGDYTPITTLTGNGGLPYEVVGSTYLYSYETGHGRNKKIVDVYDYKYAYVVNKNYYIAKDVTLSSETIYINPGCTLFIDGKLTLQDDAQIKLGAKAMLYVNNNFKVDFEYTRTFSIISSTPYKTTYRANELSSNDITYFQGHGVNIEAESDAKIIVNGNFDYKGVKAKKVTSNEYNITIANDPSGKKLDRVYEQYVFNTGFGTGANCSDADKDGHWDHYTNECRGLLQGIYIINGDITFHASNDKLITRNGMPADYQWYAMYSNAYSNPIINATFYVDGTYDMTGLYTSGLYDKCRPNFIFARSITQPYVQLNTILCADDPTYGGWQESDGYLFVICEEAIDFSKDSFGSVNLFTPFQELVNAINKHKTSETNFAQYIKEGDFKAMYPDKSVIVQDWGLPPLLLSGFMQMYQPGDIGTIKAENTFNSNGDDVM